jgi:hypothetical protein
MVDGRRRLEPVDDLAALLLFYTRDGFTGLRLAADIGAWWDRYGDAATPAGLARLASAHPELAEAWRAALVAVGPVAGLPAGALAAAWPPQGRRAALAWRLGNWDQRGDVDQIRANVTLVDGLLTPPSDLGAFVRRHVLTRTAFLIEAYDVMPDDRWRVARLGAWHAMKTCARYAVALWGLRRGRHWSPLPAWVAYPRRR